MVNIEELGNSDLERAQGLWDWAQQRRLWCRQQAEEYLKQNPLKRLSKLVYTIVNDRNTIYVSFSDDELRQIREAFDKVIAEEGPFTSPADRQNALTYCLDDTDVDWMDYIPDDDLHCGEDPCLIDIELDATNPVCQFKILSTDSVDGELREHYSMIALDGKDVLFLLTSRLFDTRLSFYDLKQLDEELYKLIDDSLGAPHHHYVIFMQDINDAAKTILEGKDDCALKVDLQPIIKTITDHPDKFDDPELLKALSLVCQ